MKIRSLSISNFRCFGSDPVTVELDDFTTLIGANGAGKTAILKALTRLFGARSSERRLLKSDFHLATGNTTKTEISLWIEARVEFHNGPVGVPECFKQMTITEPGGYAYCLVRLEGTWTGTARSEGEIDEHIYWINDKDKTKQEMSNHDRGNIKVYYVPATRDPTAQLKQATGAILYPVLQSIKWTKEVETKAEEAADSVRKTIREVPGMSSLEHTLGQEWRRLQDFEPLREVSLQPLNPNFHSLLKNIDASFQKCDGEHSQPVDRLSDGLRSLFYFALLGARFSIEQEYLRQVERGEEPLFGFVQEELAVLTIFAIEEPENHLAPQYLTHIINLLKRLAGSATDRNQVLLTSQSVAILSRIDPETIRYARYSYQHCTASVKRLSLPKKTDEAFKYVKEAVRAYPELYFAKAVVLGEGDSEAIVLPRIAAAMGNGLEEQFISFVPLGGRHVNHFWKLLNDLGSPHATLLDLDRERDGAYWFRAKYVMEQLLRTYKPELSIADFELTQEQYDGLTKQPVDLDISGLTERLEKFNVFFCAPLDLDFLMQRAFPAVYEQVRAGQKGPQGIGEVVRIQEATSIVLKKNGTTGATYSPEDRAAFVWYAYLFLGNRGKPTSHLLAMSELEEEELRNNAPEVLQRLIKAVASPAPKIPVAA
jgi:putative ATP-dependent endonuclease of OLD family